MTAIDISNPGAVGALGALIVVVSMLGMISVRRLVNPPPPPGPSVEHIRDRVLHEAGCRLEWPPLGWPDLTPTTGPALTPTDAGMLMRAHRECETAECTWRQQARATLVAAGRMKPSSRVVRFVG